MQDENGFEILDENGETIEAPESIQDYINVSDFMRVIEEVNHYFYC
jgi:hypothetical protein